MHVVPAKQRTSPPVNPQPSPRAAAARTQTTRALADQSTRAVGTVKGFGEYLPRLRKQCWEPTPVSEDHVTRFPPHGGPARPRITQPCSRTAVAREHTTRALADQSTRASRAEKGFGEYLPR